MDEEHRPQGILISRQAVHPSIHPFITNLFCVIQALQSLHPPKKKDIEPLPEIVDEVDYEESDIAELRSTFLDHGFGDESDWEDEDDDDDEEPECRPQ